MADRPDRNDAIILCDGEFGDERRNDQLPKPAPSIETFLRRIVPQISINLIRRVGYCSAVC